MAVRTWTAGITGTGVAVGLRLRWKDSHRLGHIKVDRDKHETGLEGWVSAHGGSPECREVLRSRRPAYPQGSTVEHQVKKRDQISNRHWGLTHKKGKQEAGQDATSHHEYRQWWRDGLA